MAKFSPFSFILLAFSLVQSYATQNPPSPPPPAPAPQLQTPKMPPSCDVLMFKMIDCLPYITKISQMAKPVESCCSGFLEVWKVDSNCVCEALNGSVVLGFQLNMTRAVHITSDCGFQNVSLDKCLPITAQIVKPSSAPVPPAQAMRSDADSSSILNFIIHMILVVLMCLALSTTRK